MDRNRYAAALAPLARSPRRWIRLEKTGRRVAVALFAVSFFFRAAAQTASDSSLLSAVAAGRYSDAAAMADRLLKSRPSDPWLWTMRGIALDGMGDTSASMRSYEKALGLKAGYLPALKAAAQVAYRMHDRKAAGYLDRILAIKPEEPAANAMRGVLDYEARDCIAAVGHFERAGQTVLASEAAATEYAACLIDTAHAARAIEILSQARQQRPASRTLCYDLAFAQAQNGQRSEALATLRSAPDDDAGILNLRASLEGAAGELDAAFNDLKRAVDLDPRAQQNYIDMALLCFDHNKEQRAADVLTVGIGQLPGNATLYALRGIAYTQLSRFDEAAGDFARAGDLDPRAVFSQLAATVLAERTGHPEKAQEFVRAQLARNPDDPGMNILLANLLIHRGIQPATSEFAEAKAALTRALKFNPETEEALALLGHLDLDEDDILGATTVLEKAVRLDPNDHSALNLLLQAYKKSGRKQDALQIANRLKALDDEDARRAQGEFRTNSEN